MGNYVWDEHGQRMVYDERAPFGDDYDSWMYGSVWEWFSEGHGLIYDAIQAIGGEEFVEDMIRQGRQKDVAAMIVQWVEANAPDRAMRNAAMLFFVPTDQSAQYGICSFTPGMPERWEDHVQAALELDPSDSRGAKNPEEFLGEPTNAETTEAHNFWLAPDGTLYVSNYYEHGEVIRGLAEQGVVELGEYDEPKGWIVISSPNQYRVDVKVPDYFITQRQLDTLFDLARFRPHKRWGKQLMDEVNRLSNFVENPGDVEWLEDLAEEGEGYFDDYYPVSAAGEMEPSDPYYGRNVIWDGIDGRMMRVGPRYARAIEGNIFDPDKLAAVRDGILEAEDRVVLTAPYGTASVVTPQDVKESIEYANDYPDYVLTTGDDELDRWLVEGDNYILRHDLQQRLAVAVARNEGDLGEIIFTFRDGNHRAFGAFAAGEPYVYAILEDNQFQDLDPNDPQDAIILGELL